jgi:hypothetical protein
MSHHRSGRDYGFPDGDARLDFTDPDAFPKPLDAGTSILIMNAHASVGVNPPGPTAAEPLAPKALRGLKIDTDPASCFPRASRSFQYHERVIRSPPFRGSRKILHVGMCSGPESVRVLRERRSQPGNLKDTKNPFAGELNQSRIGPGPRCRFVRVLLVAGAGREARGIPTSLSCARARCRRRK